MSLKKAASGKRFPLKVDTLVDMGRSKMKVQWNGSSEFLVLTRGKIYDVLSVEKGWYRIRDDSGETYLYPPEKFDIIEVVSIDEDAVDTATIEYFYEKIIRQKCPRCGNALECIEHGNSFVIRCKTKGCIVECFRDF